MPDFAALYGIAYTFWVFAPVSVVWTAFLRATLPDNADALVFREFTPDAMIFLLMETSLLGLNGFALVFTLSREIVLSFTPAAGIAVTFSIVIAGTCEMPPPRSLGVTESRLWLSLVATNLIFLMFTSLALAAATNALDWPAGTVITVPSPPTIVTLLLSSMPAKSYVVLSASLMVAPAGALLIAS